MATSRIANARLVRDALSWGFWEGTSNINALDAIQRAVSKVRAHEALRDDLAGGRHPGPARPQFPHAPAGRDCDAAAFPEESGRLENEPLCRVLPAALSRHHGRAAGKRRRAPGQRRRRCRACCLSRFVINNRLGEQTSATSRRTLGGRGGRSSSLDSAGPFGHGASLLEG